MNRLSGSGRAKMACAAVLLAIAAFWGMAQDQIPVGEKLPTDTVNTSNGPVRGLIEKDDICVFRGVRYGAPPVGNLRFMPPRRPEPWTAVAEAYTYGARAMQSAGGFGETANLPAMSEDCLFLNVWTRSLGGNKRPVMVWLHGGGFSSGSGGESVTEGFNLARKGDVVVVSVNHRLNVFGFLQLGDEWGPEYASSGQAGMLDIVLSLQWVRDNIARFGGNPRNVTIFGESGGGRKVAMLMAMPSAKGLFHKAIIQSGSGLDAPSRAEAIDLGRELLKKLGIAAGDVQALARAGTQAILDAQPRASLSTSPAGRLMVPTGGFVPCVDGSALPRKPFIPDAPAISADVPLLIGSNKDEMTIFRANDAKFGKQTDEEFTSYVRNQLPDKAEELIPALRAAFPGYSPSHLITAAETMKGYWIATVLQAERGPKRPADRRIAHDHRGVEQRQQGDRIPREATGLGSRANQEYCYDRRGEANGRQQESGHPERRRPQEEKGCQQGQQSPLLPPRLRESQPEPGQDGDREKPGGPGGEPQVRVSDHEAPG